MADDAIKQARTRKGKDGSKRKRTRGPNETPGALLIRSKPEWMDWFRRLAKKNGMRPTAFFEYMATRFADWQQFEPPPERTN